jgi:glycosyltransferase involved in cell wall biosynthesis
MKIAIFHDHFSTVGGAERVTLVLASGLGADVITTDINRKSIEKMGFSKVPIKSLGKTVNFPILKQISASVKFAACDFSGQYDFFIFVGDWAYFAAKKHKPNMWYCLSPTRVFYDLYETISKRLNTVERTIFKSWVALHKQASKRYLKHVQDIVTLSKNVQKRIRKYLARDSEVIYPPVDVSKYRFAGYGDFWLSVNKIWNLEKRVEPQLRAFKRLPNEKLIVVSTPAKDARALAYEQKILKDLPKNVEIVRSISEDELIDLYARCKGVISTPIDEDFGLTAIEGMACGKPIVAVNEGGYLETVIDGVTGKLVNPHANDLVRAIKEVSTNVEKYKEPCKERAKMFDTSRFISQFKEEIEKIVSKK